jgi:4-amino-4-deoxychorismate lyase
MPSESAVSPRTDLRLIETLGWRAGQGFVRLDRHLARLAGSARALGFRCDPAAARAALDEAVAGMEEAALRLRLTLGPGGDVEVTAAPFAPLPEGTVWRAAIATARLASDDALLRHKTTRRAVYDAARAEVAGMAEEALLLNERGELCEGAITSLFVERGGALLTPPLACGLLAGCLRGELLEAGRAREAVLKPADLAGARMFLGNSLRGLIPARLVDPPAGEG